MAPQPHRILLCISSLSCFYTYRLDVPGVFCPIIQISKSSTHWQMLHIVETEQLELFKVAASLITASFTEKELLLANEGRDQNVELTDLRKPKKRLDIQGIRGWAILSVVAFHFFPAHCPNGYLGVDMFFVVSGFLMAMIITRSVEKGAAFFCTFYYKRIKRILPLYYMTCLVTLIFVVVKLPTFRSLNFASSRRAVSFTGNLKISKDDSAKDYEKMLSDAMDLFTHTWSLCVEMQWYLLVPLLFCLQSLLLSRKTLFYLGIALASMVFYFSVDKDIAFYNVFARVWQFCAGIMAFIWQHDSNEANTKSERPAYNDGQLRGGGYCTTSRLMRYVSWAAFILAVPILFYWTRLAKDIARMEVTVMTAALILAGKRYQIAALIKPGMVFVGEISYALYLIHWPVFIVMKYFYPENPLSRFLYIRS
ncbi:unnamed protein product [Cylicocyclus nassatus]|uniref:Acyltransferase 3 domain-containing protein n=1 Tax=Cylicocyclus nassatus TaxID=53992 RepID=A0AA36H7Q1_CYLNA|nr:unnamed protein product [Cylicocyclus nassatus]